MNFYRLTELSPDGEAEVVLGWFTTEAQARRQAQLRRLRKFEVTLFTRGEIAEILGRHKIYQ